MNKSIPTARHCAVCGEWRNSNKGGIIAFELAIKFALESGAKMKRPDSHYAHLGCMRQAQREAARNVRSKQEAKTNE
jgi:hypothetical protein